jgi:carbon storage regulator
MSPAGERLRNYSQEQRQENVITRERLFGGREVRMLVLSRKPSQQILIGSDIRITVVKIERNQVRLGIQAPAGVSILREELIGKPHPEVNRAAGRVKRLVSP